MTKERFEELYDQLSEPIFRYCYFRVYDRERAKEIMQDTFMKTWEYASKENEIENVKAFLYRVAHNLSVNEVTRRKQNQSLEQMSEDVGFDPASTDHLQIEALAEVELLRKKIDTLDEKDAQILIMKYINDLSVKEIAATLKQRENSVSVRLHRATAKIRKLYE